MVQRKLQNELNVSHRKKAERNVESEYNEEEQKQFKREINKKICGTHWQFGMACVQRNGKADIVRAIGSIAKYNKLMQAKRMN